MGKYQEQEVRCRVLCSVCRGKGERQGSGIVNGSDSGVLGQMQDVRDKEKSRV